LKNKINYSEQINIQEEEVQILTNDKNCNNNYNIIETNNIKRKDNTTAVEKHLKDKNHKIDWKNTKILWTDNEPHKLLIKESLLIKTLEPELNRTTHSVPLYIFPNSIDKQLLPKTK
jgi:hypothetical protein